MGKVLIWFVIIISTVVLYCLMKVKAESDELHEELMKKHLIIPELSEPPVRTLGATIPENESHIFR